MVNKQTSLVQKNDDEDFNVHMVAKMGMNSVK